MCRTFSTFLLFLDKKKLETLGDTRIFLQCKDKESHHKDILELQVILGIYNILWWRLPFLETVASTHVKSCFMFLKNQWAEVVQSLGWTWCKFFFLFRDTHTHTHFSAIPPNKMCPCCGAMTMDEYQTFIYTWAHVWYSRGHCGSLANPLPPSLKLRGVVFLFFLFLTHKFLWWRYVRLYFTTQTVER